MSTDPPQGDLTSSPRSGTPSGTASTSSRSSTAADSSCLCGVGDDAPAGSSASPTSAYRPATASRLPVVDTCPRRAPRAPAGHAAEGRQPRKLSAELPHVRYLNTWNAETNTHMIAVNEALGFEPQEGWTQFGLTCSAGRRQWRREHRRRSGHRQRDRAHRRSAAPPRAGGRGRVEVPSSRSAPTRRFASSGQAWHRVRSISLAACCCRDFKTPTSTRQVAGWSGGQCDLSEAHDLADYLRLDRDVRRSPTPMRSGSPVVAGRWTCSPAGSRRKADLDRVVPDRPVYLSNRDHHGAWVNTVGLERAGITADHAGSGRWPDRTRCRRRAGRRVAGRRDGSRQPT